MTVIIGREIEIAKLNEAFDSDNSEFIALYGRRRVGKTYLVCSHFLSKKCSFFHTIGIQNATLQEQLYEFTRTLESTFCAPHMILKEPTSWLKAFELLMTLIKERSNQTKIILFFDELPWFSTPKSGFLQALNYYWNRHWVNMPTIKLVVCGSAASWMLKNIINNKGGLHNRVTLRLPIDPFTLAETKRYLKHKGFSYTDRQICDVYMIIGGIPYYLNCLSNKRSVPQNIDEICFNKKGDLVGEFDVLFSSLFGDSNAHEEIIKLMSEHKQGIDRSMLLKMTKLSSEGGTFNNRLKELEASGFITSFTPYGFKKRNTNITIIDEYILFYYAWIKPSLSTIKKIDKPNGFWLEQCQTPSWKSWAGSAFETLCFNHIGQIQNALGINASATIANWKYIPKKGSGEQGAQIDLLFERNDGVITICEIKYVSEPYKLNKQEAECLLKKVDIFKKRTRTEKQISIAFITPVPLAKTMYSEEIVAQNVTLLDLMK